MKIPRSLQLHDFATFHLCWKCCDSDNLYLLTEERVKDLLLPILTRNKEACGVKVYDFCIMDNHVHLVLAITTVKRFLRFLLRVHTSYAKQVNKALKRTGQLIKDRAKITMIDDDRDQLNCQAYLHLNRWACALRTPPEQYKHSGYPHYALGQKNPHIDTAPAWLELGETEEARQQTFIEIVAAKMDAKEEKQTAKMVAAFDGKLAYYGKPAYMKERVEALNVAMRERKAKLKKVRAIREKHELQEMQQALTQQISLTGSGCKKS